MAADTFALFSHLNVEKNVAFSSHQGQFSPLDRVAISIPSIASDSFPSPSAKLPQGKEMNDIKCPFFHLYLLWLY